MAALALIAVLALIVLATAGVFAIGMAMVESDPIHDEHRRGE